MVCHDAIRERLIKQREDNRDAKDDFETLNNGTRAHALELDKRGRTKVFTYRVPLQEMVHILRSRHGSTLQRLSGRYRPVSGKQKRGRQRGRGHGLSLPSWHTQRSGSIPSVPRGSGSSRGDAGLRAERLVEGGPRGRDASRGGGRGSERLSRKSFVIPWNRRRIGDRPSTASLANLLRE